MDLDLGMGMGMGMDGHEQGLATLCKNKKFEAGGKCYTKMIEPRRGMNGCLPRYG